MNHPLEGQTKPCTQCGEIAVYSVRVAIESDESVSIALTSHGSNGGPPPRALWGPSSVLAETGRGLLVVDQLSENVRVQRPSPGEIVVTATLR